MQREGEMHVKLTFSLFRLHFLFLFHLGKKLLLPLALFVILVLLLLLLLVVVVIIVIVIEERDEVKRGRGEVERVVV